MNRLSDYKSLGDPVEIITGGLAVIRDLFPYLFSQGRRELTQTAWNKMFPGNGLWTVRLRRYLSNSIHYNLDLNNVVEFTKYFVDENKANLSGSSFTEDFNILINKINSEKPKKILGFPTTPKPPVKMPGSGSAPPTVPVSQPNVAGFGYTGVLSNPMVLIGGVALLFFYLMND